ncbi:MAG: ABC transporter ATP-binding protein [Pseudomonadota bacterium]
MDGVQETDLRDGADQGPLAEICDLTIRFPARSRNAPAGERAIAAPVVKGVSLQISRGETLALVGESGSGKSLTALSLLRLTPPSAQLSGSVRLAGVEMLSATEPELQARRGRMAGVIFQEPMTSLNPLHTVEKQVGESLLVHQGLNKAAARARTLELLEEVGLPDPEARLSYYPHQLSGGQRQRVMIAMALANAPDLLIADEPTTALDVTIQAQILSLLKGLQRERGMGMLFITHDLGVVRRLADRVAVMQAGEIVETGPADRVFEAPEHPYTRMLLAAEPEGAPPPAYRHSEEVMAADALKVWFPVKKGVLRRTVGHVKAVRQATLSIRKGETLGVVGESGSGKTTLGLALLRLTASEGRVAFLGDRIDGLRTRELRPLRKRMQMVFQDPYGALSPRLSVAEIVAEGLRAQPEEAAALRDEPALRRRISAALEEVGLEPEMMDRYPHEFSGGQRQRISIARTMILKPSFVVLDEPTSALDMTVQTQIVALLRELQRKYGLAYLFISHDLKVVRAMAHRILVMKDGDIVEEGAAEQVLERPRTDYTKALMAAAFDLEPVV